MHHELGLVGLALLGIGLARSAVDGSGARLSAFGAVLLVAPWLPLKIAAVLPLAAIAATFGRRGAGEGGHPPALSPIPALTIVLAALAVHAAVAANMEALK